MALYQAGMDGRDSLTGASRDQTGLAAYITTDTNVGAAPLTVNFSSDRTINSTETASQFQWDFGDGNHSTDAHPKHVYQNEGSFTATLTVTAGGSTSTASYQINVANRAPSVVLETVSAGGNSATLSAAASSDPDGGPVTVSWQALDKTHSGAELNLTNIPAGSHLIQCTVTDQLGSSSSRQTIISVPDSGGYRLPDTPSDTVPGLHFAHYQMFKDGVPGGTIDPNNFNFQQIIRLVKTGTVNQWSLNQIDPVQAGRYFACRLHRYS